MFYRVKNNSIYKNNYTIKFYIKKMLKFLVQRQFLADTGL